MITLTLTEQAFQVLQERMDDIQDFYRESDEQLYAEELEKGVQDASRAAKPREEVKVDRTTCDHNYIDAPELFCPHKNEEYIRCTKCGQVV